jgi:pilus assembly protein Flp/PilA
MQRLIEIGRDDSGQDLVEYALVIGVLAFAATAGMGTVATQVNAVFTNIGNKMTPYTG